MLEELKDHYGFIAPFVRALPAGRPVDPKGVDQGKSAGGQDRLWPAIRAEEFAGWR